jgi:hypothetical protein
VTPQLRITQAGTDSVSQPKYTASAIAKTPIGFSASLRTVAERHVNRREALEMEERARACPREDAEEQPVDGDEQQHPPRNPNTGDMTIAPSTGTTLLQFTASTPPE